MIKITWETGPKDQRKEGEFGIDRVSAVRAKRQLPLLVITTASLERLSMM